MIELSQDDIEVLYRYFKENFPLADADEGYQYHADMAGLGTTVEEMKEQGEIELFHRMWAETYPNSPGFDQWLEDWKTRYKHMKSNP